MAMSAADKFARAASEHGVHTNAGNARAGNRAHDRIVKALRELQDQPDRGESALLALTVHPDESVRVWAATQLLPLREDASLPVLESVAAGHGLVPFSADMVLKEWRAGRLKVL